MILEAAPWWVALLVYPCIVFVLFAAWLLTRGSKTEVVMKGFGVELTLREDRLRAAAVPKVDQDVISEIKNVGKE